MLAGTALTASLASVTGVITLADPRTFGDYRSWVVGSVAGRDPADLAWILPLAAAVVLAALLLVRPLGVLALGDDAATALGSRVGLVRLAGFALVTVACGAATAAAGPISFVGLVVPHAVRLVVGRRDRAVLVGSVVAGPMLVLLADVVGRVVARPGEPRGGHRHGVRRRARAAGARAAALAGRAVRHRIPRRDRIVLAALVVGVLVAAAVGISTGAYPLSPAASLDALLGGGDAQARFIVVDQRLPRVVVAVAVGAALGLSGLVFQSVSRNPLGSPDVIGFSTGAATGGLVAILVAGSSSAASVGLGTVVGGFATALAVHLMSLPHRDDGRAARAGGHRRGRDARLRQRLPHHPQRRRAGAGRGDVALRHAERHLLAAGRARARGARRARAARLPRRAPAAPARDGRRHGARPRPGRGPLAADAPRRGRRAGRRGRRGGGPGGVRRARGAAPRPADDAPERGPHAPRPRGRRAAAERRRPRGGPAAQPVPDPRRPRHVGARRAVPAVAAGGAGSVAAGVRAQVIRRRLSPPRARGSAARRPGRAP
ncbi:iron chelate uptake ABC transporter family permease subunit [Clavibacter tessellarius]